MLNRVVSFFVILSFLICSLSVNASAEMYISASSACLIIANTGQVIFEKNAHEKRGIASTTKIMTALVALENCDIYRKTKAKKEDVTIEGTSVGLKENDEIDLLTLVKGMLLESGNDAANVTATLVAGGKDEFALLMNKKAKELGMVNSSFKNPSGLTEDGHYSTAYDMALLASFALLNEQFKAISKEKSFRVSYGTPEYERTFYNHNKFLNMYDGAIGIKTGFTKAAGRCLVSAVERDGVTLICVTLKAPDDWNDHKKLMDYGFSIIKNEEKAVTTDNFSVPVVNSEKNKADLKPVRAFNIPYCGEFPQYTVTYCLPKFLYGGVSVGDYIGWAEARAENGLLIDKVYMVANNSCPNILNTPKTTEKTQNISFFEKIFK